MDEGACLATATIAAAIGETEPVTWPFQCTGCRSTRWLPPVRGRKMPEFE